MMRPQLVWLGCGSQLRGALDSMKRKCRCTKLNPPVGRDKKGQVPQKRRACVLSSTMAHYSDMNELNETHDTSGVVTAYALGAQGARLFAQVPAHGRPVHSHAGTMSSELCSSSAPIRGENKRPGNASDAKMESLTAQTLLRGHPGSSKILLHKQGSRAVGPSPQQATRALLREPRDGEGALQQFRHISSTPERTLDAPDLIDDYYINVLSWSSQNVLSVGLGPVYTYGTRRRGTSACFAKEDEEDIITSVKWMHDGNYLAVGTTSKDVQIWDVAHEKQARSMRSSYVVGSLVWNNHLCLLDPGTRGSSTTTSELRTTLSTSTEDTSRRCASLVVARW